jgi:hypothetical protein
MKNGKRRGCDTGDKKGCDTSRVRKIIKSIKILLKFIIDIVHSNLHKILNILKSKIRKNKNNYQKY